MRAINVKSGLLARSVVGGLAALFLSIAAQNASAGSADDDVRTQKVKFGDLDLSKQAGAETLYGRIKQAARTVCSSSYASLAYPQIRKSYRECFDTAVANAVAEINRPTLAAFHQEQTKRKAS